jgi:hypothetical protein
VLVLRLELFGREDPDLSKRLDVYPLAWLYRLDGRKLFDAVAAARENLGYLADFVSTPNAHDAALFPLWPSLLHESKGSTCG